MKSNWNKLIVMNSQSLILLMTLTGILLAVEINYIQHGWINNDSVLYFEAAQRAVAKDWQGMMQIFPWPFFSLFIASLHQLTGFSIHLSAQILNIGFFGIATFSFLSLIQASGGKQTEIAVGALILFSSTYIVGDILPMLLRDQGFWAFFLLSLVFLVRYSLQQRWTDALGWQIAMTLAALFRIEAIVYLLALPFSLLLTSTPATLKQRLQSFLQTYSLTLVWLTLLSLVLLTSNIGIEQLGRLKEIFSADIFHELTQKLMKKAEIMESQVLGEYLDEFGLSALLLTFVYVMVKKSLLCTGIINAALALRTLWKPSPLLNKKATHVIIGAMAISTLVMFLIIIKVFVLSSRYIIPLSFMLMLLASFSLAQALHYLKKNNSAKQWKRLLVAIILAVMAISVLINILPKKAGYNYEQEAATWLRQHNLHHEAIYFDNARLRYHALEPFIGSHSPMNSWAQFKKLVSSGEINSYTFIAINLSKKRPEQIAFIQQHLSGYAEVARFKSDDGKKSVVIFRKQSEAK